MANQWVYSFNEVDKAEEDAGDWEAVRALLGGKGANLGDMTRIGVPVPPGFTVSTEACKAFLAEDEKFPKGMWEEVLAGVKGVEEETGRTFGYGEDPLLVSGRSGAKFSMPGMMDTVLNIGLNDETVASLIQLSGDERLVFDLYRRLLQMFGTVVLNVPDDSFEDLIEAYKEKKGAKLDIDLDGKDWKNLSDAFKAVIKEEWGQDFPQDAHEQLRLTVEAVFKSWNGKRAVDYRNAANISHDLVDELS